MNKNSPVLYVQKLAPVISFATRQVSVVPSILRAGQKKTTRRTTKTKKGLTDNG